MGSGWFMIYTREQLEYELYKIISEYADKGFNYKDCCSEICDLIADLDDPNEQWKNVP